MRGSLSLPRRQIQANSEQTGGRGLAAQRVASPSPAQSGIHRSGVTVRSIVIGVILAILHTCWIAYEEVSLGHVAATNFTPVLTVVALLFILLALSSVLKRVAPALAFSPPEMIVIFVMTTLSAVMVGNGYTQSLFQSLLWPQYMTANPERYGASLMPSHLVPQNKALIKEMFVGSNYIWRFFQPDVARAWLLPLIFWGGFILLLMWTMLCLCSIFRRPWAEHERLTFPTIELPLMMAKENSLSDLFRSRFFLAGFSATSLVLSMNYLSFVFPAIPSVNLNALDLGRYNATPPFTTMNPIGIAFGLVTFLQIYYWFGAASDRVSSFPFTFSNWSWNRMAQWTESPHPVNPLPLLRCGLSAGIVVGLVYARSIWVGLPLNPIGYVLATIFAVEWIWNLIFVIWLIKWLVLRFGGLALYRKSLPLFFGIAVGDAVTQIAWGLLFGALGVRGASPYGPMRA